MESNPNAASFQRSFELQVLEAREAAGKLKPGDKEKLAQLRSGSNSANPIESDLPLAQPGVVGPDEDRALGLHKKHKGHSINGLQGLEPTASNRTPGQFNNRDSNH